MANFLDSINKTINTLDSLASVETAKTDSANKVLDSLNTRPMYEQSLEKQPLLSNIYTYESPIIEDNEPIAESVGKKAKEDIISKITGLDIGGEKFKTELNEYETDSKRVSELEKEFNQLKELSDIAYKQAWPRWDASIFPDFTYNSNEEEKRYNTLKSEMLKVGNEINKITNKWYDLDLGSKLQPMNILGEQSSSRFFPKNRAKMLRESLGILHDESRRINKMKSEYFAAFGEPTEGSVDVDDLMYDDLMEEKKLKEELNMRD